MKFSIITINYNNAEGLRKTMASLFNQTYADYEFIVIDGGSNDGSVNFIQEREDRISFWCSEPDKGIYNAMNKGVFHARGEYLIFMNSGDIFHNQDALSKVAALQLTSDIVACQILRMDNGQLLRPYVDDVLVQLMQSTLNHQATFIRRSVFDKCQYDERFKIVSDWKFWVEAILFQDCSYQMHDLVVAEQDMSGISNTNRALDKRERAQVMSEMFPRTIREHLMDYTRLYPLIKPAKDLQERHSFWYLFIYRIARITEFIFHKK